MAKPLEKSWYTLKNESASGPVTLYIHGFIGNWEIDAIDLIRELVKIGDRDLVIRMQSGGGSVYEGLAMYNAIKAYKGKTTGVVDGYVASISTYVLMACDEIQMPENAAFMIHNPEIGAWGGEAEIESALTQLKNAKATIADGYATRSGKALEDVLAAMEKETWFTAKEALEFGLIDAVIDPVNLTNCIKDVPADFLSAFKNAPSSLVNHINAVSKQKTEKQQGQSPLVNPINEKQVTEMASSAELQAAIKEENERQQGIRALCAQHKVNDTLRDEMLNDVLCCSATASVKILNNIGQHSVDGTDPLKPPQSNLTNSHLYVCNGKITKDTLQNALNARCGVGEADKDNPYKHKTLIDMAEIALGKNATGASSRNELVARAFNSGDFSEIITEGVRTVMRDEAKVRKPLWREIANTEDLPNFKETDLVIINDAPDLMKIADDGEYKTALITGTGEKIQLATFGRSIKFTRHAIINDEISLISKAPRKFMQAAYRLSDKLMFNAMLAGKMGDGGAVFKKDINLFEGIKKGDYTALIMALHKSFARAKTAEGDALDLRGEFILASPDHASFIEAVLNTPSKAPDFNPVYKKIKTLIETARLDELNGALALTARDFDSVIMGFLDGAQEPWLETGDGWSSDGAKFRITYDIASKVVDRRGIACATFA